MKNRKRVPSAVRSGLFWIMTLIPFFLLPAAAEKYPVTYGKKQARSYRQCFSLTKPQAKITPADLRPQVSLYHDHFYYDYQPSDFTTYYPTPTLPTTIPTTFPLDPGTIVALAILFPVVLVVILVVVRKKVNS